MPGTWSRSHVPPLFRSLILEEQLIREPDYVRFVDHTSLGKDPELTARLLDCRNRFLDPEKLLQLERTRSRRMLREATRMTPTAAQLRRIFRGETLEDRSWEIPDYRGDGPSVQIPAKIGKSPATSIGPRAFSVSPGPLR